MAALDSNGQKPLAGVVMCCTAILPERRHELAVMGVEMGAIHKYDLTSDVTHLIIGSVTTDKYAYVAKERPDVKVLLASYIEAVRNLWMSGSECNDEDLDALEETHRAPTFYGLKICLTGIEDTGVREEVKKLAEANGAEYHPDLTKKVTHLIAATPTGRKYEYACKWGVNVVSEKWLADSIARGLTLDERLFHPTLPAAEQGKNAWRRELSDAASVLGKRRRQEDTKAGNKRKLRRTMSAKLGSNPDSLWADISVVNPNLKIKQNAFQESADDSILEALGQAHEDLRKAADSADRSSTETEPRKAAEIFQTAPEPCGIFSNTTIVIYGFPTRKLDLLSLHLTSNGAKVVVLEDQQDLELDVEGSRKVLLMIPYDLPQSKLVNLPTSNLDVTQVTEWWLESCIHQKRFIDPYTDCFAQPIRNIPIPGFEGLQICCTGLKDMDLLHFSKTIPAIGGNFEEFLRPTTSVLVCRPSESTSDKLRFAWQNGTPVVTLDWLFASMNSGTMLPFQEFELTPDQHSSRKEKARAHESASHSRTNQNAQSKHSRLAKQRLGGQLDLTHEKSRMTCAKPKAHSIAAGGTAAQVTSSRTLRELSQGDINRPSPSPPKAPTADFLPGRNPFEISQENSDPTRSQEGEYTSARTGKPTRELTAAKGTSLERATEHVVVVDDAQANLEDPGSAVMARSSTRSKADLHHSIAALLAAKEASAMRQSSDPSQSGQSNKRKRTLGRALSGNSMNASLEGPRQSRLPSPAEEEQHTFTQRWYLENGGDDEAPLGGRPYLGAEIPMPSQGLIYEDEAMRQQKEKLLRKLGGRVEERVSPVKTTKTGVLQNTTFTDTTGVGTRRKARKF